MPKPERLGIRVLSDDIFSGDVYLIVGSVDLLVAWVRRRYKEPSFEIGRRGALGRVIYHDWEWGGREAVCYYTEAMFRQITETLARWRKQGRR